MPGARRPLRPGPRRPLGLASLAPRRALAWQVWEGEGYADYYGRLHGQVLLLFEGAAPPAAPAAATEALLLHGCTTEAVPPEEGDEAWELSISDAEGEIYSVGLADEGAQGAWLEALAGSARPQPIARATHILLKHQGSRRLASWRDPDGVQIKQRTEADARRQLLAWKRSIERGLKEMGELAQEHSDCDTAEQARHTP